MVRAETEAQMERYNHQKYRRENQHKAQQQFCNNLSTWSHSVCRLRALHVELSFIFFYLPSLFSLCVCVMLRNEPRAFIPNVFFNFLRQDLAKLLNGPAGP